MIKRLTVISAVCLFVLCVFAIGAFATSQKMQSVKLQDTDLEIKAPQGAQMYRALGYAGQTCADDPDPQAPIPLNSWDRTVVGTTAYDYQANGSIGRQICIGMDRYFHFVWCYAGGEDTLTFPRSIRGYCIDTVDNTATTVLVDAIAQGGITNPQIAKLGSNGSAVYVDNRGRGAPVWNTALGKADEVCGSDVTYHWDVPDYLNEITTSLGRPAVATLTDSLGEDWIHIVPFFITTTTTPYISHLGYVRCYFDGTSPNENLICETYANSAHQTYTVPNNSALFPASDYPIGRISTAMWSERNVVTSPVSKKVAVVFNAPIVSSPDYDDGNNVVYVQSTNNGQDWVTGTNWPPTQVNVTNYTAGPYTPQDPGTDRPFVELSACYDYYDNLHVAYVTTYIPYPAGNSYYPYEAWIYHWSQANPTVQSLIKYHVGHPSDINFYHTNQASLAKVSISAKDPVYHPLDTLLFVSFVQFDSTDISAGGLGNGELYAAGSRNGGFSWEAGWNLTNTKNNGCNPPDCPSEAYPSLAVEMTNGDLHIQYYCDQDPGVSSNAEGTWTVNNVYYYELPEWEIIDVPKLQYKLLSPREYDWFCPPMQVSPGGSRDLFLEIKNVGGAQLTYGLSATSTAGVCVTTVGGGVVDPGDYVDEPITFSAVGPCNTIYGGNVTLTTNDVDNPTITFPYRVIAADADSYYECPLAETDSTTVSNGTLQLWLCSNSMEKVKDLTIADADKQEVFFNGSNFCAMSKGSGIKKLVGRWTYMYNSESGDQNAGARDKLYEEQCEQTWEPHFWILYTKNVFFHDLLNPPVEYDWWWLEESKQVKLFKESAAEPYKHIVILYKRLQWHDPPSWWPAHGGPIDPDVYVGVAEDIDAPWTNYLSQNGRNYAGYDDDHEIAWLRGHDTVGGSNPEYDYYYAGLALANGGRPGEDTIPYGAYCVRNDSSLYPQDGWGWDDDSLYTYASTPGVTIIDPDSIVDRSWVLSALHKTGVGPGADFSYTVIKATAQGSSVGDGLALLEAYVELGRTIVQLEKANGYPVVCGDCNGLDGVEVGDIVTLINYLYKGYPITTIVCPRYTGADPGGRADCNSLDGIEVGDIVTLINYLYKGYPASTVRCFGIYGPP
jgi:hypothetical protein